jgi:drug/metabolite transporter (DMT)-like permease
MNFQKIFSHFGALQISVALFGGASIFGYLLPLNPVLLVWGRTVWASIFLLILMQLSKESINFKKIENYRAAFISGALLAMHWVTFYQSIQSANIAVAVTTFSCFPLFTVLLAPLFSLGNIKLKQILFGILILIGISILFQGKDIDFQYLSGIIWGIFSAFSFALLTLSNKKLSVDFGALGQAFWQNAAAAIILLPSIFYFEINLSLSGHLYWMLFGTIFTGLSHGLYMYSLKKIDAQKASFYAALEPIYAIIWVFFIYGTIPGLNEIAGGIIILLAVRFGTKN